MGTFCFVYGGDVTNEVFRKWMVFSSSLAFVLLFVGLNIGFTGVDVWDILWVRKYSIYII